MKLFYRTTLTATLAGSLMLSGAGIAAAGTVPSAQDPSRTDLQSNRVAPPTAAPQALPVIAAPIVLACVGTVGLSAYQAYKGGDPVEYIASAILGCIPFGAAAKPAIIAVVKANAGPISKTLRALGAGTLATSLCGDAAGC